MSRILLLSPHTDDVELGCGGSVAKFIEGGNEVMWIAFSTAEDSLPAGMPKDTLKREFEKVIARYGLKPDQYEVLGYQVRNMHQYRQEILEHLVRIRRSFRPDVVVGPSAHDLHQDHQVVSNEMMRAFKSSSSIICYELPWNHVTFDTQLFVALQEKHMEKKWEALQEYKSQILNKKSYFDKEFIFGAARLRGIQCNEKYAEAFEVVRWRL